MYRTVALAALLLVPALAFAQSASPAASPELGAYAGTWDLSIPETPVQATLVVRADGTGTYSMPALSLYPREARVGAFRVTEDGLTAEVDAFSLEYGADLPIIVRFRSDGAGGYAGSFQIEGDERAYPLVVRRVEG